MTPTKTTLPRQRMVRVLWTIMASVAALSFLGQWGVHRWGWHEGFGLVRVFHVNEEHNVSTWFSTALLLSAVLFGLIARQASQTGRRQEGAYWGGLAVIFSFLSLDETVGVHEGWVLPLRQMWHATGLLYYPWVVLGAVFVALVASVYWRFWWRLPPRTRWGLCAAASMYLTGVLLVEALTAYYDWQHQNMLHYEFLTTIEESLEMGGIIVLIDCLLQHVEREKAAFTVGHEPRER